MAYFYFCRSLTGDEYDASSTNSVSFAAYRVSYKLFTAYLLSLISWKTPLGRFVISPKENEETTFLSPAENLFKVYDGVETFVMFIGYPRSSHSLVGAILDAHPEIVIPHEFNLMQKWKKYQSSILKKKTCRKILYFTTFTIFPRDKLCLGYVQEPIVIGDKKGGDTSFILIDPNKLSVLEEINQVVQVPMKFIHVTRNPFDNISTMLLRNTRSRDSVREEGARVNRTRGLDVIIGRYFELAASNQRVRERYGDAVIDIPGHETVLRPKETLQRLCDHLGVTCSEDYLEKCSKIMFGTPSVTRDKVVWSEEQIMRVTELMKSYPFLEDYSFDKYHS
ncbi:hypothetical protein OS493_037531 [Desmophyllum pertusum]|uniref:Protein-tyrosine sulfotransferase n=1 Tax=Desmophyllum pertusum TaxID=174260 RepID=A0A9W9ZJV2_9CNID|nr:hypothetical protein OS493_037531 [Desmophyllum pertusum]